MYAAQKGYPDTVRILLEHGAEICGEWHTIIFSISINPSIYLYTFICVYNSYNCTLNNKLYVIDQICINLGHTSLIMAAKVGSTKTVRILLEHGADVNSKDENGELNTIIFTISIYPSIHLFF